MKRPPDDLLKIAESLTLSTSSSMRRCQGGSTEHLEPFRTRIDSGCLIFSYCSFTLDNRLFQK
jgi:hypothetical protein